MIWDALLEFLLRLAFGLGVGLLVTPSTLVPAGFFRVHLWVLLGMYTLAALFTTNWSMSGTPRGSQALSRWKGTTDIDRVADEAALRRLIVGMLEDVAGAGS